RFDPRRMGPAAQGHAGGSRGRRLGTDLPGQGRQVRQGNGLVPRLPRDCGRRGQEGGITATPIETTTTEVHDEEASAGYIDGRGRCGGRVGLHRGGGSATEG